MGALLSPFSGFVGLNENLGVESDFSSFFGLFGLKENSGVEVGAEMTSSDFLDMKENGLGSILTGEATFTGEAAGASSEIGSLFSSLTVSSFSASIQDVPYFLRIF